jgi:2',3'-cyclic-nucleotide 2'-phosphodiesterase (5'-nucleotidase family)
MRVSPVPLLKPPEKLQHQIRSEGEVMTSKMSRKNTITLASAAAIALTLPGTALAKGKDCNHNFRNKLQIIHSSDNESSFQDPNTLEEKILNYSTINTGLQQLAVEECIPSLHMTAGDHTIPGPFYQASDEVFGEPGIGDIWMYNAMGLVANGMGNHEFDGGIEEFAYMLNTADYPFIAANLDFSQVVLEEGTPEIEIGPDARNCAASRGRVVKSCFVSTGGHKIGFIGRAPADFFNVIEDPENTLGGLDFVGGRDPETNQPLVSAVGQVLEQVELLEKRQVKRIVLIDHAQDFTGDPLSANVLRGIDVIVAAGTTGFMAQPTANGPFNLLRPEDTAEADYPTVRQDMEGNTVLVVNSDQQYRYVGNLIVEFDKAGLVVGWDDRSGPIATTSEGVAAMEAELGTSLSPDPAIADTFLQLQNTSLIQDAFAVVGTTTSPLNGQRADVRSRETNLGRLAADSTTWFARNNGFPGTDIAFKNGGGIRDSILGPTIIRLSIQAALAFDNTLTVLEMSGDQVLAAMENSVSRVPALDGRFPQVAGVQMEYDANFPGLEGQASVAVPSRVRNLTITKEDGTMVDLVIDGTAQQAALADTFVLATNSFTATGGDGYAAFAAATVLGATATGEQEILEQYIINELGAVVDLQDPPVTPRVVRLNP